MALIQKRTRQRIGGLRTVIRPVALSIWDYYKRYGCIVMIKANRRRRRRRGVDVIIKNHYYGGFPAFRAIGPEEIRLFDTKQVRSRNARRTTLSEYKIFASNGRAPSGDFPVKGVFVEVIIKVGSDERYFSFSKGKLPRDFFGGRSLYL